MITEVIDPEFLAEDATKFDGYDDAIIGYTEDGRLVYDATLILAILAKDMPYDDAVDFFDYNTLRTVPYMGAHAPVIMWPGRWVDDLHDT